MVSQPSVLVGLTGMEPERIVKFSPGLREINTTEPSLSGAPTGGEDTVAAAAVLDARG